MMFVVAFALAQVAAAVNCGGNSSAQCAVPSHGCVGWGWVCRGECAAYIDINVGDGQARAFLAQAPASQDDVCSAIGPTNQTVKFCGGVDAFNRCRNRVNFAGFGLEYWIVIQNANGAPIVISGNFGIEPANGSKSPLLFIIVFATVVFGLVGGMVVCGPRCREWAASKNPAPVALRPYWRQPDHEPPAEASTEKTRPRLLSIPEDPAAEV
jgi:hypothetical protein